MGAWLFQGNEDRFPVTRYLRDRFDQSQEIQWNVGKTRKPVQIGDRAFVWRAEGGRPGTGGLIAVGRVSREPRQEPDEWPREWYDRNDRGAADNALWHVWIRLEDLRLEPEDGMLRRVDLKTDPELEDLCILKMPRPTVCAVEPRHERALLSRWASTRPARPS